MYTSKDVAAIATLRPETIVALEGVSFGTRALALPGVIEFGYSLGEVAMVDQADQEPETIDVQSTMRISPDTGECMLVFENHIIAGGLKYDRDASTPLEEGSANGNIYHARTSRGDTSEQKLYFQALGFDAEGSKDFNLPAVQRRLVDNVVRGLGGNIAVLKFLLETLRDLGKPVSIESLKAELQRAMDQEGWQHAPDYLADYLFGYPYWHRLPTDLQEKLQILADLFSESEAEACWDRAVEAGEVGNQLAVVLDIYEHGGVAYSVTGGGMQCRWDTSRAAAVWVPDDDAIDNIRSAVLSDLGIGQIRWFGALGSVTDPLHAMYSVDGETWIGAGKGWSWNEALTQLAATVGLKSSWVDLQRALYDKALDYCKSILDEYNDWCNGSVYGVVCYVIDRKTGRRMKEHDAEVWGCIGHQYAEEELEGTVLNLALELCRSLN